MAVVREDGYEKLFIPREGVWINPRYPNPDKMSLDTIAQGLATEFRYGGHTDPLVNVAEHAVDTAALLEEQGEDPQIQLYGLHHDSAEAYLGDYQKPNKEAVPGVSELEDVWQECVWDFLGVEPPTVEQYSTVKEIDCQLYSYETDNLYINEEHSEEAGGAVNIRDWDAKGDVRSLDEIIELGTPVMESKQEFIDTHNSIISQI